MAAFPQQHHHPFLLDSVFFPHTTTTVRIPGFSQEPNTPCFPQFYPPLEPIIQEAPHHLNVGFLGASSHSNNNNEPSLTYKQSTNASSVVDNHDSDDQQQQVTQKVSSTTNPLEKKRRNRNGFSSNSAQSKEAKEVTGKKKKKCNGVVEKKKPKADKKNPEEAPTGYIHVRARRGQATDSHSLAERVRREKISERMKLLQALVPGCDKVTGKALMLDEIINYVQSLQNQVEFLSMKLATVNPMSYDFAMDLDAIMVRPEMLSNLGSTMQNVQQCSSPGQHIAFTTDSNNNSNPLLDSSYSFMFQQEQRLNLLSQDNGQLLWDVDEQRQKLINQTYLISNNLSVLH